MNRSLKLSMLLALGLGSAHAAALELGQIQIKSALGQPLLAEIPVSPKNPAELRNLSARLAAPEDFARAGISGGRPSIPLQFSVASAGGRKVIRITSDVPVSDPYLDLLVEVNSAAGKSVHEFPILLDPPGMASEPTQSAVSAAPSPAPQPAASVPPRTATAPAATSASTSVARTVVASNGKLGPVQRGQTLSAIARQTTPAGVDANQMLLALKQANPDAFYRDNVNALKSGVVLRVPSSREAQALGAAAALAEIRRENNEWRAGATRSPTTVADAATRADTSGAPTSAPSGGDRLALVPAKQGGSSDGTSVGGKNGAAATTQLHQDLLRNQEAVSSLQEQSGELKSRVKDLEDINGKNQRLLSLKDNEIADLQQQLAKARSTNNPPSGSVAAATPSATAASVAATPAATGAHAGTNAAATIAGTTQRPVNNAPTLAVSGSAASVTPPAAVKPAVKPVRPANKPVPVPAANGMPWYMQTWAWATGGAVIVLLLLLALAGRRRKPQTAALGSSLADRFSALPDAGSHDVDQEELLDQLSEHPDDVELHLELATLYYSRGDVEHFEAAAEAMHAHITDPQQVEWQDVVRMGEDLAPSHPLFAGATAPLSSHNDAADESGHADTAAMADGGHMPIADANDDPMPGIPPLPPQKKLGEYHFDFDLTGPRAGEGHPHENRAHEDLAHEEPAHEATIETPVAQEQEPVNTWNFEVPEDEVADAPAHDFGQFSDDPIDTKLDLARAYMDMGDAEGARAMLEEVQHEGNQMQQDAARHLLENIH